MYHTWQTIEHLKNNVLARDSDLIIFSDGSKTDKDENEVQELRNYLRSIKGFNSCTVIEREENYGLAKNIIEGVTEVINRSGKVIVLEDDLATSKNFLCYMNESLEHYRHRRDVFSISGYTSDLPSLRKYDDDTYLSYRPSSWGWATWRHQWDDIDWSVSDFKEFINNKEEVKKFNRGGMDMARMLNDHMKGKNDSWAIRWSYEMYKREQYSIHPQVSKIQNIGFGEGATHCTGIDIYRTTIDLTKHCRFSFCDALKVDETIIKEFRYQFSYMNKAIKRIQEYIRWRR